jgi:hypothetical protein
MLGVGVGPATLNVVPNGTTLTTSKRTVAAHGAATCAWRKEHRCA